MKLPKQIAARIVDQGSDDEYIDARRTAQDFAELDETVTVGVYQLVDTVEVKTEVTTLTTTKSKRVK